MRKQVSVAAYVQAIKDQAAASANDKAIKDGKRSREWAVVLTTDASAAWTSKEKSSVEVPVDMTGTPLITKVTEVSKLLVQINHKGSISVLKQVVPIRTGMDYACGIIVIIFPDWIVLE